MKFLFRIIFCFIVVLGVDASHLISADAQTSIKAPAARSQQNPVEWINHYQWLTTRIATEKDLNDFKQLDEGKRRVLRNYIYAVHGCVFKDAMLQSFFNLMPWYHPQSVNKNDIEKNLSYIEEKNIHLLNVVSGKYQK